MQYLKINLQLFKGGSTVVNNSTYTPTEYELQLQKQQADYAGAVAPNALWLNDVAKSLLNNSMGAVQVDYNKLNNQAQDQINKANQSNMDLANNLTSKYTQTGKVNQDLIDEAQRLNTLTMQNNKNLANGQLPAEYQKNMEASIQSGLTNTLGNYMNNAAANGVLNSSVTNASMNDMQKNVANTMAQQYQSNIGLLSGLNNSNSQQSLANIGLRNDMNNVGTQQYLAGAGLLHNINNGNIQNAPAGMTAAAGAQEAAQQPALNLWNASLGLNGAGNSTLNALAGKGNTSTTQTTSGGGGLFGGLLGGLF